MKSYYLIVTPVGEHQETYKRLELASKLYKKLEHFNPVLLIAGISSEQKERVSNYLSSLGIYSYFFDESSRSTEEHYTTNVFKQLSANAQKIFVVTTNKLHALRNSKILKDKGIQASVGYTNYKNNTFYELLALLSYLFRKNFKALQSLHKKAKKLAKFL